MKKWYESKSIWLGVLTIVVAGLSAAEQGASAVQIAMAIAGAAMIAVRAVTSQKIGK